MPAHRSMTAAVERGGGACKIRVPSRCAIASGGRSRYQGRRQPGWQYSGAL